MKINNWCLLFLFAFLFGCSQDNRFVGVWKATSVDMGNRIPPEVAEEHLKEYPISFDLNSDKSARVFNTGNVTGCDGYWEVENEIVYVQCPYDQIILEVNGEKLTTLPERSFTFERLQ